MDIGYNYFKSLNFYKHYILLIILVTYFLFLFIFTDNNNKLKKLEEEVINDHINKIEKCIDFENKNKRSIYENIKLSEYCMDKFGIIR